ncbi:MAG: hypothetical protein RL321_418, partial [Pseudomonadota bacterium]
FTQQHDAPQVIVMITVREIHAGYIEASPAHIEKDVDVVCRRT